MDDKTLRLILKLNFLAMALFLTLFFMSSVKKNGLGAHIEALLGMQHGKGQINSTQPASH